MLTRKSIISIAIVATLVVAITGGYLIWQGNNLNQPTASPSPSPSPTSTLPTPTETPAASPQMQARDAAIAYISMNHNETAQFMTSVSWTGGREDTGLLGAEKYVYNSAGWAITIQYPVVPNPIYTINATYVSPISQVTPEQVIFAWQGTWQNGTITETSYTNAQLSTQEQVRDAVINYIRTNHAATVQYAQNLTWTGGRTTPSGIVGSETYLYESKLGMFIYSWALEIKYPVVLNPIYTVSANYTGLSITKIVAWQGTWQAGVITETSYSYTP